MARTGRPRKPTKLKVLQGTDRPERHVNEPKAPEGFPSCPKNMGPVGRAEHKKIKKILEPMGHVTLADEPAVRIYLVAHERAEHFGTLIADVSEELAIAKGYCNAEIKYLMMKDRMIAKLGLSPPDRARINMPTKQEDPMGDFLKRGRKKA